MGEVVDTKKMNCFEQWQLIESALGKAQERGAKIIIGTDADEAGDRLAERLTELVPGARRDRPTAKDWNEQLQKVEAFREQRRGVEMGM